MPTYPRQFTIGWHYQGFWIWQLGIEIDVTARYVRLHVPTGLLTFGLWYVIDGARRVGPFSFSSAKSDRRHKLDFGNRQRYLGCKVVLDAVKLARPSNMEPW